MKNITKDQFVALLNDAGLSDAQKQRFHALFEKRHPESHQGFLEFLGLSPATAQDMRARSRES